MSPFVHLHTHSYYSFLNGASSIESLCKAAKERGFTHLALTDTNGFYGLQNFLEIAPIYHLKPIVGVFIKTNENEGILIAKKREGYSFICDILTCYHMNDDFSLTEALRNGAPHVALITKDIELLKHLKDKLECWVEIRPGSKGREVINYARENNLPPLATNAVYFANQEDFELHKLLRAIDLNSTISDLSERDIVNPDQWLKPEELLRVSFPHIPEALKNTWLLARDCQTEWRNTSQVFPAYQDKEEDHFDILRKRCLQGIKWRYGKISRMIKKRLDYELSIIREKGYVDYFLVVADIADSFPIHCGRGSAAASLVSYLLGITHVDPIKHNLSFFRFLNPNRRDLPDIDIDFPWDERDKVLEFVNKIYGNERMAMVANHVGFRGRGAIWEVAKVFGLSSAEIKRVTKRLSIYTRGETLKEQIASHPRCKNLQLPPPWPRIISLASQISGFPKHLSVHCGGTVIVPDKISKYVPIQKAPKGVNIIQWEKDQAETAGLVKIDLLGNRSLSVIRDTLKALQVNYGYEIDYSRLNPLQDSQTLRLLAEGRTMGIFYVESPAMRQLQKMTGKGDFEHLVIHSSMIRPAANRYIKEYVRRLHGKSYKPLHPLLKDELTETYGIMCYQENVTKIAVKLAGFDYNTAEELRKTLTKKSAKQIGIYKEKFFNGCRKKGIREKTIAEVWKMIESFGGYSFCKPHSASYALVSFKAAYLKAHFPAEFMAAVISNGGGYYSTFAYISEAKRLGIKILGPDINRSEWHYSGKNKVIRIGLQQLKHIKKETVNEILRERKKGKYRSLEDLLTRVRIKESDFGILVKSGTLDSIANGYNRPQMFWYYRLWQGTKSQGQWFSFVPGTWVPNVEDYSWETKLKHELETLGLCYSVHPLSIVKRGRKLLGNIIQAKNMKKYVGQAVSVLGWLITRKEVMSGNKEPMEFVSFEDETEIYDTVIFSDTYRRFCQHLDTYDAFILRGKVTSDFGALLLEIKEIHPLGTAVSRNGAENWFEFCTANTR